MAGGGDQAKREFDAMMKMRKIDVAVIEAARRGYPIDFLRVPLSAGIASPK
jgi:hypothetical protein